MFFLTILSLTDSEVDSAFRMMGTVGGNAPDGCAMGRSAFFRVSRARTPF